MRPRRYSRAARVLHWLMAVVIAATWGLGYYASTLSYKDGPGKIDMIVRHKTFGVAVLTLLVLRFVLRLARPAPPFPATMHPLLQRAAHGGHWLLYALMLAVPVTGILHSAADGYGTPVFGLFTIPAPFAKTDPIAPVLGGIHEWLVWAFLIVVAGHIAVALKHRFVDRDDVFASMAFGGKSE